MRRWFLFLILSLCFSVLYGYSECLNNEKITEQCIKELYKTGDYFSLMKNVDSVDFKNKNEKNYLKAETFFRIADYDEIEKIINKFPANIKNSLYYRVMLIQVNLARKRFNQVLEIIETVKENYPHYYLSAGLECIKGDIFLYRKQYDSALETYDKCLKIQSNPVAEFNRILSLEKEKGPQTVFFQNYIEYFENNEGNLLAGKIVEKMVELKKKNNFPNSASAYYSRWLSIMRKTSKLDIFFNDDYLKISYPSNSEIVKYLIQKKRFSDAISILDENIKKLDKDTEQKYLNVVEKYRALVSAGQEKQAADFMVESAETFSDLKKERLLFFAGTIYYDAGFFSMSRDILEEIVYKRPSSRYFMLALFKLGLIYLSEGKDLFAYTLWTNYIYGENINFSKYIGGKGAYDSISGLVETIDRLNGFCTFTTDIDYDCSLDKVCQNNFESRFITYYDFLYFHLIEREEFKNPDTVSNVKNIEKWKENYVVVNIDEKILLERIGTVSKPAKSLEPVVMIEQFLSFGNREGIDFYLNYINSFLGLSDQKKGLFPDVIFPPKEVSDEISPKLIEFKNKTGVVFKHYFNKTGDLADHYYNQINNDLTYSPHYGKKEDWKLIYPAPYINDVLKLSLEFNVPPQLIYSIMRAETFYRDNLFSNAGALGLMQIMPATFEKIRKFGGIKVKDPMNPYDSMKASVWYLSKLIKRFDNNYIAAIAAYNAGPHRVSEWIKRYKGIEKFLFVEMIPFYETRAYVKKVVRYFEIYSYLYEGRFYNLGLKGVVNIEENPDIVNF